MVFGKGLGSRRPGAPGISRRRSLTGGAGKKSIRPPPVRIIKNSAEALRIAQEAVHAQESDSEDNSPQVIQESKKKTKTKKPKAAVSYVNEKKNRHAVESDDELEEEDEDRDEEDEEEEEEEQGQQGDALTYIDDAFPIFAAAGRTKNKRDKRKGKKQQQQQQQQEDEEEEEYEEEMRAKRAKKSKKQKKAQKDDSDEDEDDFDVNAFDEMFGEEEEPEDSMTLEEFMKKQNGGEAEESEEEDEEEYEDVSEDEFQEEETESESEGSVEAAAAIAEGEEDSEEDDDDDDFVPGDIDEEDDDNSDVSSSEADEEEEEQESLKESISSAAENIKRTKQMESNREDLPEDYDYQFMAAHGEEEEEEEYHYDDEESEDDGEAQDDEEEESLPSFMLAKYRQTRGIPASPSSSSARAEAQEPAAAEAPAPPPVSSRPRRQAAEKLYTMQGLDTEGLEPEEEEEAEEEYVFQEEEEEEDSETEEDYEKRMKAAFVAEGEKSNEAQEQEEEAEEAEESTGLRKRVSFGTIEVLGSAPVSIPEPSPEATVTIPVLSIEDEEEDDYVPSDEDEDSDEEMEALEGEGDKERLRAELLDEAEEEVMQPSAANEEEEPLISFAHHPKSKDIAAFWVRPSQTVLVKGSALLRIVRGSALINRFTAKSEAKYVHVSSPNQMYVPIHMEASSAHEQEAEILSVSGVDNEFDITWMNSLVENEAKTSGSSSSYALVIVRAWPEMSSGAASASASGADDLHVPFKHELVPGFTFAALPASSSSASAASSSPKILQEPREYLSSITSLCASKNRAPIVAICGLQDSGNSSYMRMLTNALLGSVSHRVLVVDANLSQPEFTAPGFVSATMVDDASPITSNPIANMLMTLMDKRENLSLFVGQELTASNAQHYMKCVSKLVRRAHAAVAEGIPVVLITPSSPKKSHPFYMSVFASIARLLRPDHIIDFNSGFSSDAFTSTQNVMPLKSIDAKLAKQSSSSAFAPTFHHIHASQSSPLTNSESALAAYFSRCPSGPSSAVLTPATIGDFLVLATPRVVSLRSLRIWTGVGAESVSTIGDLAALLNASVIALGSDSNAVQFSAESGSASAAVGPAVLNSAPICRFHGLGIVKSIDLEQNHLHILTPMSESECAGINTIVRSSAVPNALLTQSVYPLSRPFFKI